VARVIFGLFSSSIVKSINQIGCEHLGPTRIQSKHGLFVLSDTSTPAAGEKKNRQQHKDSRIKKIKNPKSHHATRNVHTHTNKYNIRIKKKKIERKREISFFENRSRISFL
jgi:hypothetical protein